MPMSKKQKVGKRRLDKYYYLAKQKGYRSRSAFKLQQLNSKFNFLNCNSIVDLCAAPGGWLQIAKENNIEKIVGIDLFPIKHIPGVTTIVSDITTEECKLKLIEIFNNEKVDVFIHDGSPNVGSSWVKDSFVQNELVLSAVKLASEFLKVGGCFLTKIFRSKDYFSILYVLNQLFERVEVTKPLSSRSESAEIYAFCANFKDSDIDPQLFSSENIFKENDITDNYFFKEISFQDFLNSSDPKTILEVYSKINIDENVDIKPDLKILLNDLKLLSEVDKKNILKMRDKILKSQYLDVEDSESEIEIINEKSKLEKIKYLMKKKERNEKKDEEYRKIRIAKNNLIQNISMKNNGDEKENHTNVIENVEMSSDEESCELNETEKETIVQYKTDPENFVDKSVDRRAHDEDFPDFYEEEELEYNSRVVEDTNDFKKVKIKN